MQNINAILERFEDINDAYPEIAKHLEPYRRNWFRYISKRIKIDVDSFRSDFEETLYHTLVKYRKNYRKDGKVIPFEHYFASAIKKKAIDLTRSYYADKNKIFRDAVPFNIKEHDIMDTNETSAIDVVDEVLTVPNPLDRKLVIMRMKGYSIVDVCRATNLSKREYWTRVNNLRANMSRMVA